MPKPIKDKEIPDRLLTGREFVRKGIAERDQAHCRRYIGGTHVPNTYQDEFGELGELPNSQQDGEVNYLAINIATKIASITIGDPDFYCKTENPQYAELARQFLKSLWTRWGWSRVVERAGLKWSISGLGIVARVWDSEVGPVLEHVDVSDFACDPNVTNWKDVRWAGRRIYIPYQDAVERFPQYKNLFRAKPAHGETLFFDEDHRVGRAETVEMWYYYDKYTEALVCGDKVIERDENRYGEIPFHFLEGSIAPRSPFPIGDYDIAIGIQTQMTRIVESICEQAENGGAIPYYVPAMIDGEAANYFSDGRRVKGWIPFKVGSEPLETMGYIRGEPLNPTLLQLYELEQRGMDAATGINGYIRGDNSARANFATEAALIGNLSGGRGRQNQIKYENFIEELSRGVVDMMLKFGGSIVDPDSEDEMVLLEALASLEEITIVESSTAYKDPEFEIRQTINMMQALMPFVQMGIVNPVPLAKTVLQAYRVRNIEEFLMPAPGLNGATPGTEEMPDAVTGQDATAVM